MEVFIESCASLDVHSETIEAFGITEKQDDENQIKVIKTFPTITKDLFRLLKWLKEYGIIHIAMERTDIY